MTRIRIGDRVRAASKFDTGVISSSVVVEKRGPLSVDENRGGRVRWFGC